MAKLLSWLTTKHGKIFTRTCIGVGTVSTFALQLALQGPYQEKVRDLCQMYNLGKPKPLSEKVQKLIDEVLEESNLKDNEKKKVKFFNVIGQELSHTGGTNSPWGAMVGIPFYIEDINNINFGALRFQGQDPIDWVIDGQDLIQALSLPDKAKKFALMREIYSCDVWNELENAAILPFCILMPAEFSRRYNLKKDLFNKTTLKNRLLIYFACFCLGIILYRLLKDPLKHISDIENDKQAALTSPDYLEGGIEFYEHILMRNKALRELLREKGEKQFDKMGNENYILLAPKLPITKRLELLQEMKKNGIQNNK